MTDYVTTRAQDYLDFGNGFIFGPAHPLGSVVDKEWLIAVYPGTQYYPEGPRAFSVTYGLATFNTGVYGKDFEFRLYADNNGSGAYTVLPPSGILDGSISQTLYFVSFDTHSGYVDIGFFVNRIWTGVTANGDRYIDIYPRTYEEKIFESVDTALFTGSLDEVNFNVLSDNQRVSIDQHGGIYDALGGNDVIVLPNTDHYQLTAATSWSADQVFHAGAGDDQVTGANGNDNVDLGPDNDTFFGSLGSDHVWGGDGSDTFDYSNVNLGALSAELTEILDGGAQGGDGIYLPAQPDVLKLPGRQSDYVVTSSAFGTKLQHTGPNGTATFDTTGIEKVYFKDLALNDVQLKTGNLLNEMVQLTVDVYDQSASALLAARHWQPLSAIELGLLPYGSFNDASYSLVEGYYRATWNVASIPHFPDSAVAEVAVGSVNGVRTLTLTFEGTVEKADWLYDFGSFRAYYLKYEPLIEAVDRYVKDNGIQQVLVEGHSLGASMVQLFMDSHPDTAVAYKAVTVALPGIAFDTGNKVDPRTIGIIHANDVVGNVPALQHNGTQIYINAGYVAIDGSQHADTNYATDFATLLSFATNPVSPFADSALGKALASGSTSLTFGPADIPAQADGRIQVAVGIAGNSNIFIGAGDDYVLGATGNDHVIWGGRDGSDPTYSVVDAGPGDDEVLLPGFKSNWVWSAVDTHFNLLYKGTAVGELWHVEKLVFTFIFSSSVDLTKANASTAQQGSPAQGASDDLVPVVWLDGHAATVQQPGANDTQLAVSSTVDYVDVGNRDLVIAGSTAGDIVMLGTGHQVANGGDGNDILNGVRSAVGSVLELHGDAGNDLIIGGAGKDFISGESGADILTGGSDADTFSDTAANLNSDTITDFSRGDRIVISDATVAGFSFLLTGDQLSFTGGSLTASNLKFASLIVSAAPEGGVQITFGGPPIVVAAGGSVSLAGAGSASQSSIVESKDSASGDALFLEHEIRTSHPAWHDGLGWSISHATTIDLLALA